MKHRDHSFSLIFVAVILAHLSVIAWLFLGQSGCQQDLTASQALTPADKPPVQLNLSLADRVTPKADATKAEPSLPPRQTSVTEDPESRLVLPQAPTVQVPAPEPIPVDDSAEKAREAAKQKALLAEQQRRTEEAEAKLAQLEKEKQRAIASAAQAKREAAKKERLQNEAAAKAEAKREADRKEKLLAQQRQAKAASDALKRKQVEAELERERIRQREAEKLAEAERERQALAAAKQQEAARKAEEARILAERLERERVEAAQIERAKVVSQPAVVRAKPVGEAGGTGPQDIVAAKPTGGNGRPAPIKVDMAGYRVSVEKMIRSRWTVPKGIAVDQRPEVILRINRAGKVVYSRLSQKSGNPNLDRSAINAVQIGSRLIPLPPGYDEGLYEVKVKFEID